MQGAVHLNRRAVLRVGALSILAPLPAQLWADSNTPQREQRRNCIFILLQGGPSHHDLWDPKPDASQEIRGPFEPIASSATGIRFGELLTESARIAQRFCIVRSVTHGFNNHIAGTYITLTGSTNQPNQDREAHGDDFPGPGAILNYLQRVTPAVPRSVSLPNWLSIPGPSNRMPGQYSGFLGSVHDPFLIEAERNAAEFRPLALSLPDGMTTERLGSRIRLSDQLDSAARLLEREQARRYDGLRQSALEMVADGRVREALDLSRETEAMRSRYGRTRIGQGLLMARRLVEAGVQFVSYNSFNQEWDTHGGLLGRYRQLIPPMDRAFATLVEDLAERGLSEQTLVINTGEFGRTPRINKDAGRDHWPNVYSTVLAGGGVQSGLVYGASDAKGAEVAEHPVSPADILATMWRQLGIAPNTEIHDRLNRPHRLCDGRPIEAIC